VNLDPGSKLYKKAKQTPHHWVFCQDIFFTSHSTGDANCSICGVFDPTWLTKTSEMKIKIHGGESAILAAQAMLTGVKNTVLGNLVTFRVCIFWERKEERKEKESNEARQREEGGKERKEGKEGKGGEGTRRTEVEEWMDLSNKSRDTSEKSDKPSSRP
jgi:hypothetical protein